MSRINTDMMHSQGPDILNDIAQSKFDSGSEVELFTGGLFLKKKKKDSKYLGSSILSNINPKEKNQLTIEQFETPRNRIDPAESIDSMHMDSIDHVRTNPYQWL